MCNSIHVVWFPDVSAACPTATRSGYTHTGLFHFITQDILCTSLQSNNISYPLPLTHNTNP